MQVALVTTATAILFGLARGSPIRYATYNEIVARLQSLQAAAPDIVSLWNAQDAYGLESPGDCGGTRCLHWFLTISNRSAGRDRELLSNSPSERPQVFVSGNLHGDEKVGPMTLIHFAGMLRRRWRTERPFAHCETNLPQSTLWRTDSPEKASGSTCSSTRARPSPRRSARPWGARVRPHVR